VGEGGACNNVETRRQEGQSAGKKRITLAVRESHRGEAVAETHEKEIKG